MRIQITLEDKGNGVKVTFKPSLADMVRDSINSRSRELSPAQQYAMTMASAVKEASKKLDNYDPSKEIVGL